MRKQQDAKIKFAGPDIIGGDKQERPQLCEKMQTNHKPVNPEKAVNPVLMARVVGFIQVETGLQVQAIHLSSGQKASAFLFGGLI
jgi:hypothetical protein